MAVCRSPKSLGTAFVGTGVDVVVEELVKEVTFAPSLLDNVHV
jgi:hypothetical protein